MQMHLQYGSNVLCRQRAKQKLRTTNIMKMETCKKCTRLRKLRGLK